MRLPYPVPLNVAYRNFRGRTILSPKGREWKVRATALAQDAGLPLLTGAVRVQFVLHPKITKQGLASLVRPDIDGIFKLALDALNGVAWVDDKQIEDLAARLGPPVAGGALSVFVESL